MILTERAPAKINLCLFLGPTRPWDGRHELVSVMQSLTLADELRLEPAVSGRGTGPAGSDGAAGARPAGAGGAGADSGGSAGSDAAARDEVVCPGVEGPNLAGAALAAFREATGWDAPPQRLTIVKRVPVAAGMGGGSGDAAAALRLAARASGLGDHALLHELATGLGADVPAQVRPGRVLATGAGEHVARLPDGGPFGVLVLPGTRALSTAAVYREADRLGLARAEADLRRRHGDIRSALDAAERCGGGSGAGGIPAVQPAAIGPACLASAATAAADLPLELLVNDLQPAALALAPEIEQALAAARAVGADMAIVSGSGPTALGLFLGSDGLQRAHRAADTLADRRPAPLVAAPEPSWRA